MINGFIIGYLLAKIYMVAKHLFWVFEKPVRYLLAKIYMVAKQPCAIGT